jgi:hypothetical protein
MNIPDINRIADFRLNFSAINPGMSPENNPDQYMLFWNLEMNSNNKMNVDDLNDRLRKAYNLINDCNDKIRKLEGKIKDLENEKK